VDADGRTLEFPSDFAVQRIRPAATPTHGEEKQAPHQWVLPPAARVRPAIAVGPMRDECDDAELDGYCYCEEPREQAKHNHDGADGFCEEDPIGERERRFDPASSQTLGEGDDTRSHQLVDA